MLALTISALAIGGTIYGLAAAASSPARVSVSAPHDPLLDHMPAPRFVAPPDPAPEPAPAPTTEPAPEPPPPSTAPKRARAQAPATSPAPAPAPAPTNDAAAASQLVSLVNRFRADNGLPALSPASDAMAKAQQHARDMAAQGRIYHSSSLSSGISPGWTALGENVGTGGSASQVESMFQASSMHRANLLNESFNQIGVGAAIGNDGALYVTEVFVGR